MTGSGSDLAEVEELLRELTALPGPTGEEDAVLDWLEGAWRAYGRLERTAVGNLLLHIPGEGPRLLVAAHADELSLIVRSVTREGFLRVLPGERDQFTLPCFPGVPLQLLGSAERVPGVLATTTGHALTPQQKERSVLTWDDLFVDTGRSAEELTELGVGIGTRAVWDVPLRRLGRLVSGKALDDRIGLAVLTMLARSLVGRRPRYSITLAATVQEEIGMLGAASLGRDGERYDVAITVDNGLAGDIPTVSVEHMPVRLGGGPVLVHRDSAAHFSRRLIAGLRGAAAHAGVPVQEAVLYHYGSEGANLIRQGIETALVAPPIRYSHSPFETADPADVAGAARMLETFVTDPAP
jgi:putative aminopeptidase FrvX